MQTTLAALLSFYWNYSVMSEDEPDYEALVTKINAMIDGFVGKETIEKMRVSNANYEEVETVIRFYIAELIGNESGEAVELMNTFAQYLATIGFDNRAEELKNASPVTYDNHMWLARSSSIIFYHKIRALLNGNLEYEIYEIPADDLDVSKLKSSPKRSFEDVLRDFFGGIDGDVPPDGFIPEE